MTTFSWTTSEGNAAAVMIEILSGFVVFGIAVLFMALGVLAGRPAIKGSCGGLAGLPGHDEECMAGCTRPCPRRAAREAKDLDKTHDENV